jgi:phenylalanyl-tRNA synthetase beta chain
MTCSVYQIVRTTLLPGILRIIKNILEHPGMKDALPLRLFEISDVVFIDPATDTRDRNEPTVCATVADVKSKFQEVHGSLERFFVINGRPAGAYKLVPEDSPTSQSDGSASFISSCTQISI